MKKAARNLAAALERARRELAAAEERAHAGDDGEAEAVSRDEERQALAGRPSDLEE